MELKWVAKASAFDRTKNIDHHDLTAKHYFGRSRSPDVDGIKIFDDQAAKHYIKIKNNVLRPGHLHQKL